MYILADLAKRTVPAPLSVRHGAREMTRLFFCSFKSHATSKLALTHRGLTWPRSKSDLIIIKMMMMIIDT